MEKEKLIDLIKEIKLEFEICYQNLIQVEEINPSDAYIKTRLAQAKYKLNNCSSILRDFEIKISNTKANEISEQSFAIHGKIHKLRSEIEIINNKASHMLALADQKNGKAS